MRTKPKLQPSTINRTILWAIFVGIIGFLIPKRIIVRGDDFGYLESAVNTIQACAVTQSDWLEPFNLPLPAFAAGVFMITGNLWLATLGVAAGLAVLNFALLRVWLAENGLTADFVALALVLCPWWINKAVDYTGVALGLALLMGALVAWKRSRRGWFFLLLLVAVANRQSAICLLAFPAMALVRDWRRERTIDHGLFWAGAVVVVFAVYFYFLMPQTFARSWAAANMQFKFSPLMVAENFGLGLVIFSGIYGGWCLLRGDSLAEAWRENLARPIFPICIMVVGTVIASRGNAIVAVETPGLDRVGPSLLVLAALVGPWLGRWRSFLSPEILGYLVLYACMVSLRGQWWDYYFLEPALVLVATGVSQKPSRPRIGWNWWWVVLLVMDLVYAAQLHFYLRHSENTLVTYESVLREKPFAITQASDASFGYLGWKLFATAKSRGLERATKLSDFLKYVEAGRTRIIDGEVWTNRRESSRSLHPSGELWQLPAGWRDRKFPLTNREWADFLRPSTR